jgi:hypothetical protein
VTRATAADTTALSASDLARLINARRTIVRPQRHR